MGWRVVGLILFVACLTTGCATTDLSAIHESNDTAFVPERDEQQIWRRSRRLEKAIEKADLINKNPELQSYLDEILAKLLMQLPNQPNPTPKVAVLETPTTNAYALPHGALYIHAGLLLQLENDAEVAVVLGHELSHFLNRHALKSKRQAANTSAKALYSSLFVTTITGGLGAMFVQDFMDWELSVTSGYSQQLESEADDQSLKMILAAGYDPAAAPSLFRKLLASVDDEDKGDSHSQLYASHPKLTDRLNHYSQALSAQGIDPDSMGSEDPVYQKLLNPLRLSLAQRQLDAESYDKVELWIDEYLLIEPESGDALFLLGELKRHTETDLDVALDYYQMAADQPDGPAESWREIGLIYRSMGQSDQANQAFQTYLSKSPDAVDAPVISSYLVGQ